MSYTTPIATGVTCSTTTGGWDTSGVVTAHPSFTSQRVIGTNEYRVQYHTSSGTTGATWHNDTITTTVGTNIKFIYTGTTDGLTQFAPGQFMFNDWAPVAESPPNMVKDAMERMLSDPEYLRLQIQANNLHDKLKALVPIADQFVHWNDSFKKVVDNFEKVAACLLAALPPDRLEDATAFIEQERAELKPLWKKKHHAKQQERAAESCSMRLLKEWLSEAEWNYLQENDQLEFPSQYEKDVIYIVKRSKYEKVQVKKTDKIIHELCIHSEELPTGDMMLANILLLKTDEKRFLATANKHLVA